MDTKITKHGHLRVYINADTFIHFHGEDNPIQWAIVVSKVDNNHSDDKFISPALHLKNIPNNFQKKVGKENLKGIKGIVKKYLDTKGNIPKKNIQGLQEDLADFELK